MKVTLCVQVCVYTHETEVEGDRDSKAENPNTKFQIYPY
jgi:hypothetical protein